ncbi:MAG: tyrosine--tRNA ligase [Anaerolineae bacterium]|nr:tyrosine--tRNA ligase [Anaerolineae bacterium]
MNLTEQTELLMQGTEYGDDALRNAMAEELMERLQLAKEESRPLRIYCGYDPRTTDLHLGHTVTMRKMRQFQDLGHEVTFLIGNFTSLIGDPSDKDVLRPRLMAEEVAANAQTYAQQAMRILDPSKTTVRYNAEWLSQVSFLQFIELASNFTVQQFLTRENFRNRFDRNEAIYLHETFYSLMQGYDAYSLKTDIQIGGTDQLFNIVTAARKIMTFLGAKPNIAIILGILPGTDGVVKMSKSLGNHIPINTDANDMYGKVMSIPDSAMPSYFRLVTRWSPNEIREKENGMNDGTTNPRNIKMALAYEIVSSMYGDAEADSAQENFIRVFQNKDVPDEMPEYHLEPGQTVLDVMVAAGLAESRSKARNLVGQGGVKLDGETLREGNQVFPHKGVLKAGKIKYIRVV